MTDAIRDGASIISELHILTTRMMEQRHDTDFLIKGVEKRQTLIDEYQAWAAENPGERAVYENDADAKRAIEKILGMDQVISKALGDFKNEAQSSLQSTTAQQKVIGYLGNSISASGSYMDFKK